jgi:hypothetical protein
VAEHKVEPVVRFRISSSSAHGTIDVGEQCHTVHRTTRNLEFMMLWDSTDVATYCHERGWQIENVGLAEG